MGKYTILEDPRIDEFIDSYLKRIVKLILKCIPPKNIRSIVLAGSFGKGEGSVVVNDQCIEPLRDFDICIILRERLPDSLCSSYAHLLRKLTYNTIVDSDYPLMGNMIPEIKMTTLEDINSLPDITTYDLKFCKILYGEDIRPKIIWDIQDIPLRTNARALFQKGIALIGVLRSEYLHKGVPPHLRASFLREVSRVYIEISTGLCLLAKRYHPSCLKRLEILKEILPIEFKEFYEKVPYLLERIELSTKYKVDPTNNPINVEPLDFWFKARDDLGEMIKFYLERWLNIDFNNWIDFSAHIERKMAKEYYLPIIKTFLQKRKLPTNSIFLYFSNFMFNIRENVFYFLSEIKRNNLSLPLPLHISPAIKVFSVVPLLLFAVSSNKKINYQYVNIALKKLKFVKPQRKESNPWNQARHKLLRLVFSINMI